MIKNNAIKYLAVFFLFFTIFLGWHYLIEGFWGCDPYYHAKYSNLILQSKDVSLVKPWVDFHFFTNASVDHSWFYHVIQAIFIYLFGIIWGTKILSAVWASLIFVVFYYILNKFKIKYAFVWTSLLFIISSSFTARLLLERPFVGSISFSLLCFYFIVKKKYLWLAIASTLFIMHHQLGPMVLLLLFFYLGINYYLKRPLDLKLVIAVLSGILLGIIIHPESLNYINILFTTFWQLFYLKFSGVDLRVGAEVQISSFIYFLKSNKIISAFYVLAVALFMKRFVDKKSGVVLTTLFLLSFFWLGVSLLVARGVDYWVPFGMLFIALTFNQVKKSKDYELVKEFFRKKTKPAIILFFIYAVLIITAGYNIFLIFDLIHQHNMNNDDIYYKQANEWLIENTEKDSIVYYPIWSMFPKMFFYNDYNRYIVGLDPTYIYLYNPETYYIWANIAYNGIYCAKEWPCFELSPRQELEAMPIALKRVLNTKTLIIPNGEDMWIYKVLMNRKQDFEEVYRNRELVIFRVK